MAVSQPARVVQVVPEGEQRSREPVILENEQVQVKLSPVGGGRVVEYVDKKNGGTTWKDVSLLALSFPDKPVPVEWDIPFRTIVSNESRSVTFIHTATGGEAAPWGPHATRSVRQPRASQAGVRSCMSPYPRARCAISLRVMGARSDYSATFQR